MGGPSGVQPAPQAAAAALRALRAALVNAHAFPQLRAPTGSTPCEVNKKDGQLSLTVLTCFGGPSGGQPAAQAAAAALCALRAALVNAHAFPQLRAPTGSTPCEVNKKDGQLSLTVLTCFGWAVRGSNPGPWD